MHTAMPCEVLFALACHRRPRHRRPRRRQRRLRLRRRRPRRPAHRRLRPRRRRRCPVIERTAMVGRRAARHRMRGVRSHGRSAGAASLQVDDALLVTAQPRQRHRAE
jgi:hypothetical protein